MEFFVNKKTTYSQQVLHLWLSRVYWLSQAYGCFPDLINIIIGLNDIFEIYYDLYAVRCI